MMCCGHDQVCLELQLCALRAKTRNNGLTSTTDLLIIGTGKGIAPLSPDTRKAVSALGMRVEVLDTRNAAAQFNLLATERGVSDVAAVLIPIGWKDGQGVSVKSRE